MTVSQDDAWKVFQQSPRNVHQLGNVESDQMLCGIRRRASWFNQAQPGFAFAYRFDYWLGAQLSKQRRLLKKLEN